MHVHGAQPCSLPTSLSSSGDGPPGGARLVVRPEGAGGAWLETTEERGGEEGRRWRVLRGAGEEEMAEALRPADEGRRGGEEVGVRMSEARRVEGAGADCACCGC